MKSRPGSSARAVLAVLVAAACSWSAAALQWGAPAPSHPPGRHVAVAGARLWVESEGDGKPLILIAGGPGLAHDYFHPYFSRLAGDHRLIYFDGLGRGRSQRGASRSQYRFSRDVEDLEGLRKALGLARVRLFGHSYGGLVALAYAAKYPSAVDKLILANSPLSGAMWQAGNDHANRAIRTQLPGVWSELQRLRAQGLRSSSPAHQRAYRLPAGFYFHRQPDRDLPLRVNAEVYYAITGEDADFVVGGDVAGLDFGPQLKTLKAPLQVLAGRHDKVAPLPFWLAATRGLPRASLVVFERSGHFTFVEETDRTLDAMRTFLAR